MIRSSTISGLPAFLTADSIYINFIGYEMPHWCEIPEMTGLPFDVQVGVLSNDRRPVQTTAKKIPATIIFLPKKQICLFSHASCWTKQEDFNCPLPWKLSWKLNFDWKKKKVLTATFMEEKLGCTFFQKNVAIPYESEDSDEFSKCSFFTLNYSAFKTEDFILWNRSAMIPPGTETRSCASRVYDRSVFFENVLSRVSDKKRNVFQEHSW